MTIAESIAGRTIALPPVRGPWTEALYGLLRAPGENRVLAPMDVRGADVLADDDLQMALYLCYELHYAGIQGIDERMEWSPAVLMLRSVLEAEFEAALRAFLPVAPVPSVSVGAEIMRLVREDAGPPLSRYVERQATLEQLLEHVVHRSAYQLKEADPHSWAIPRLDGAPKAALLEVQADEYGGGRPERMHSRAVRQDDAGAGARPIARTPTSTVLPGITLATVNLMSAFGLRRRRRGAHRRPPGDVRDDLLGPQPPLRQRLCAGSASAPRRPTSTTSTSRPTPCTRTSPPRTWPAGSRRRNRSSAPTSSSAPAPCWCSRPAGPRTCSMRGDGASARSPRRCTRRSQGPLLMSPTGRTSPTSCRCAGPRPVPLDELTAYLRRVVELVRRSIVVDGSPPSRLRQLTRSGWRGLARTCRPSPRTSFADGKGERACSPG